MKNGVGTPTNSGTSELSGMMAVIDVMMY
jgi:hypothetical protein